MAGTMMVIAMMPVMPNYIAAGTTHEAYAAAQTYNEERTASYEEKQLTLLRMHRVSRRHLRKKVYLRERQLPRILIILR